MNSIQICVTPRKMSCKDCISELLDEILVTILCLLSLLKERQKRACFLGDGIRRGRRSQVSIFPARSWNSGIEAHSPANPKYWVIVRISMNAPALSSITLGLEDLPPHSDRDTFHCFERLLHQFSHVKKRLSLKLSREFYCPIAKTIDVWHRFPQLGNVELLKIQIRNPWPWWCHSESHPCPQSLLWPCGLVKNAPFLQKLSIKLFHLEPALFESSVHFKWMDGGIPKKVKANGGRCYSHQCLRGVEFIGFTGSRLEVELVLALTSDCCYTPEINHSCLRTFSQLVTKKKRFLDLNKVSLDNFVPS